MSNGTVRLGSDWMSPKVGSSTNSPAVYESRPYGFDGFSILMQQNQACSHTQSSPTTARTTTTTTTWSFRGWSFALGAHRSGPTAKTSLTRPTSKQNTLSIIIHVNSDISCVEPGVSYDFHESAKCQKKQWTIQELINPNS